MPEASMVFAAVDQQDMTALRAMFAADGRFVFGNQEPLLGIEAIMAGNTAFFTTVQCTEHHIDRVWTVDATTIAETDVTYTRLDGKEVTLPTISIWTVDSAGLITDYQIYSDTTPIIAP
ncbi:nuclear transport factor 2 family protein [Kribbella sp. NBC_01505]|uniref:nuclear transport factor 2 family protein n=1 Tax=Kribbella sp. NBC_01505 TaxID=2903580 RepID=UPI003864E142